MRIVYFCIEAERMFRAVIEWYLGSLNKYTVLSNFMKMKSGKSLKNQICNLPQFVQIGYTTHVLFCSILLV